MKNTFKGFYNSEQNKLNNLWNDSETLFVFDANVLLNLYGYAARTRDDFFSLLKSIEGSIWIPYQAGLEYQRRRLTVIKNEKYVFTEIQNNLDKIQNIFKGDFEQLALKRRFPKLHENTEKLEKEVIKSINNYNKSVCHWNEKQPCVRSHDSIRDQINHLFDGKVGDKPENQKWLDELYLEGSNRFKNKIPPGFKDANKAKHEGETSFFYDGLNYERQYGDLILWKQLIDKAKEESINNIVFVTDDAKDDWWYKVQLNGKKVIGPLAELQAEIYSKSNIEAFHMYSTSTFMSDGELYTSVKVEESSILDAQTSHVSTDSKQKPFNRRRTYKDQAKEFHNFINSRTPNTDNYKKLLESNNLEVDLERYRAFTDQNNELSRQMESYSQIAKQMESYSRIAKQMESYSHIAKQMDLMKNVNNDEKFKSISDKYSYIDLLNGISDGDSEDIK